MGGGRGVPRRWAAAARARPRRGRRRAAAGPAGAAAPSTRRHCPRATRSSSRSSWSSSRAGVCLTASAGTAWPTWTPRSAEAAWAHGGRAGREAAMAAALHFQIREKYKRYFSNLSSEETAWGSIGSFLRDVHVGSASRPILALCCLAQQHL